MEKEPETLLVRLNIPPKLIQYRKLTSRSFLDDLEKAELSVAAMEASDSTKARRYKKPTS